MMQISVQLDEKDRMKAKNDCDVLRGRDVRMTWDVSGDEMMKPVKQGPGAAFITPD